MAGLRVGLIRRIGRLSRSGGDIGVLPVRWRVPVPLLWMLRRRLLVLGLLVLGRPTGRVPAGGSAVVGLRWRIGGSSVGARPICAVLVGLARGGLLARLGDRGLERGLGYRLRPLFAALDRQLAGRLDRRLFPRGAAPPSRAPPPPAAPSSP